jgi:hypothetical protein
MKKTKDGRLVTVGMAIWVNPECVFEDEITPNHFTGKHVVDQIRNNVVLAHPEHSRAISCDFLYTDIFAKEENWREDRSERYEEVILAKRETMMLETARMQQELARIEQIRDEWWEL